MSSPTFALARALARGELPADEQARVAGLAADVARTTEPVPVVTAIATAGVMPLAYRHLVAGRLLPAGSPLAATLADEFQKHARSRFVMTRRLRDVVGRLDSAGIETLAHKGPALAVQLYGNFAMRQFGDIDLIVRPADAARAVDVLASDGWRLLRPHRFLPGFADRARGHEVSLVDTETSTLLELHWTLTDRFDGMDVSIPWLMHDATTVDLIGRPVRAMRPERLLLALAVHGTRHIWPRLSWLADLADLMRRHPDLDWNVVLAEARRIGFVRGLGASILLAHEVVGGPKPAWIVEDGGIRRGVSDIRARLDRADASRASLIDRARWEWRMAGGTARRAALVWRVVTTPSYRDAADRQEPPSSRWRTALPRAVRLVRTAVTERRRGHHRG